MKDNIKQILNWVTIVIWAWFLLAEWTPIPVPDVILKNDAIVAFSILALQILAHTNLKDIFLFRDKEINMIILISGFVILFMFLTHSRLGAFFTVFNFCILWYVTDKWKWTAKQILALTFCFLILFIRWMFIPIPDGFNPNTVGTVTTFSMLPILAVVDWFLKSKKWSIAIQLLMIGMSIFQLLKYHGRATLICLICYIALRFVLANHVLIKQKAYLGLCLLITAGSILLVFLYTALWLITDSKFVIPFFEKPIFSGREKIWYELWGMYKHNILTGIGSNISLKSWFQLNVHNAMYDILVVHGLIVFLLFISYIIYKMIKVQKQNLMNPSYIVCISGVIAIYIESFFDMDLFWVPEMLVWCFLLVIMNTRRNEFKE